MSFVFCFQNNYYGGQSIQRPTIHPNIQSSSVPIQWPNIDAGNQGSKTALSSTSNFQNLPQISQGKLFRVTI